MATANAEMLPEGGAGSIQGVGEPVPVLVAMVSEGQVATTKGDGGLKSTLLCGSEANSCADMQR